MYYLHFQDVLLLLAIMNLEEDEQVTDMDCAEFAGRLIVESGRVSYYEASLLQEFNLVALMQYLLICRNQAIN